MGKLLRRGSGLLLARPSVYLSKLRAIAGPSLIGLWPLGEQSGSVAQDLSGRGHHGAYTGVSFVVPGAELLPNTGLETLGAGGADIWNSWEEIVNGGAIADEASLVHGGIHAAKLTGAAAAPLIYANAAVVPWTQYAYSVWSRGDGTNSGRYSLYDQTNGPAIVDTTATGIAAATYGRVSATLTAPGGCLSIRNRLLGSTTAGGIAYFDDASLYAAAPNGPISGYTAPYFDGTNDFCNIYSAALAAAFNGAEGTLLVWARVGSAGVWTDGVTRYFAMLRVDDDNRFRIQKNSANNTVQFLVRAGGTGGATNLTTSTTNWLCLGLTWASGVAQAYAGGVVAGAVMSRGTWAGTLGATSTLLGAYDTSLANVLSGLESFVLLATRAFTPAEVWAASQVGG